MKCLLLLLLTAIALATTIIADKKLKTSIEEEVSKQFNQTHANIGLYGQLTMTCYAFKKKYINQEQRNDMLL